MKLTLELCGSFCNSWPQIDIYLNDLLYFSGEIVNRQVINIEVPDNSEYAVKIIGIDKKFGENNVWDTRVVDGKIVEDKTLSFIEILIDDVPMGLEWIRKLHTELFSGTLYTNATLTFTIKTPILNWIIDEKYINNQTSAATFSGGNKFSYDKIINKINSIKKQYFNG